MSDKQASRFNEGKPQLGYIFQFPKVIEAIARIKEFGAAKYEDGNWKKGNKPDKEYIDSMARHLTKFISGEDYDSDSGCSHLGQAIWNLMVLLELNFDEPLINEEVFFERKTYWSKKKDERKNNDPSVG